MKVQCVVIYQQTPNNYCAYIPDFLGCVSTGKTWEDIQRNIKEAIDFHIDGMMMDGDPFPERYMTMEEAVAYHNEPMTEEDLRQLAELEDNTTDYGDLPDTFGWLEVEVPSPAAAG